MCVSLGWGIKTEALRTTLPNLKTRGVYKHVLVYGSFVEYTPYHELAIVSQDLSSSDM